MINILNYNTDRIYVIGDVHGEFDTLNYLIHKKHQIKHSLFIQVGDFGVGFYKENFYKLKLEWLNNELAENDNTLLVIRGNHDCFDNKTELLTDKGWIDYDNINSETIAASYSIINNEINYHKIIGVVKKHYSGHMFNIKSQLVDLLITPQHKFLYENNNNIVLENIENVYNNYNKRDLNLIVSSKFKKNEHPISDNLIKLIAWIITDGSVIKNKFKVNRIRIYQSENKYKLIEKLLTSEKISFKLKKRDRTITQICGKILKKPIQTSYEFWLDDSILNTLIEDKYIFPKFIKELSIRQKLIFIEEFVLGDGSKHKSNTNTSWMVYGKKEVLDQLQEICVLSNIRSTLSVYRKIQYRLNIYYKLSDLNLTTINFKKSIKKIDYNDYIWCVQTIDNTVIVRRNGKISIQGNCPLYFNNNQIYNQSNLILLPDYSLIKTDLGNILCVGGEASIDYKYRTDGKDFWKDELPFFDEIKLKFIVDNNIDINYIITHGMPTFAYPTVNYNLDDEDIKEYCKLSRKTFEMIYQYLVINNNKKIKKWYSGHYHEYHFETINNTDFIILDINEIKQLY